MLKLADHRFEVLFPFILLTFFQLRAESGSARVTFRAEDGLLITADYYAANDSLAPTIILFHQSVSSRGEYVSIAPRLQKAGFNALAVDLRWGRRDFWNHIINETGERYGITPILKAIDEEGKTELIWPTIFDSYQDMEAALRWVVDRDGGPVWIWGSSFSAMLQFKLANEHPNDIAGMISFSPGEYYPEDTLLMEGWAKEIRVPLFISCGKGEDELRSGQAIMEAVPHQNKALFHSQVGRHGSSMLFVDEENWTALLSFLGDFLPGDKYLKKAIKVGHWLETVEKKEGEMIFWPDELGSDKVTPSLSVGMSGKILFLLELWQATQENHWLEKARKAGVFLLDHLPQNTDAGLDGGGTFSLYGSICGSGIALSALYQQTLGEEYKLGLEKITRLIKTKALDSGSGVYWDLHNDVLTGLSGTGLFLLEASEILEDSTLLQLAEKTGMTLLSRALETGEGLNWYWAQDRKFVLPNFTHGTAGMGYFLACLYQNTGDARFLDAAEKAGAFLLSNAYTEGEVLLFPYGIPNEGWERPYDLGWAHGPAGSARLFYKLYEITRQEKYLDYVKACARAIMQSGWPSNLDTLHGKEPFTIDMRFGLAGMAEFLIHCSELTDDTIYTTFSRQLADEIISHAKEEEQDMYWRLPAYGFMEDEGTPKIFTGYFYGAAGFGMLFLQLDRFLNGKRKKVFLPDNPFGRL